MLGIHPAAPLKPSVTKLISATSDRLPELRRMLDEVDTAFQEDRSQSQILNAVRAALEECQRTVPDEVSTFKRLVFVRGGVAGLDAGRLISALEGAVPQDAAYFRMYARAMEGMHDLESILDASEAWDQFRLYAWRRAKFPANGLEVATLYLHMASLYTNQPDSRAVVEKWRIRKYRTVRLATMGRLRRPYRKPGACSKTAALA